MSIENKKKTIKIEKKMGKEDYLGNKILQRGGRIKKNLPYGNGFSPFGQSGGANTRVTPRIINNPNIAAIESFIDRVGPANPVDGVDRALNRAYKNFHNRKRKASDLPTFNADLNTIIIPPKRRAPTRQIGSDVKAFLASIRPSTRKTENQRGPTSIHGMLQRVGAIIKGNKRTRWHKAIGGWYLHGKHAGKPMPGRRAAMIRGYTEAALRNFKKSSSKASSSWMQAAKRQRGRGLISHSILGDAGKLAKTLGKKALLRAAMPLYDIGTRILRRKGRQLLQSYINKKQKGKGVSGDLSALTQFLGGAASFGTKKLLDKLIK